ncbi:hypothetical protein OROGR_006875 [Orobanche gracilis]
MEGLKRGIGFAAVALLFAVAAVILPEVAAVVYKVGDNKMGGWAPNANLTDWVRGKHFYKGDWLSFVFDRNQFNVLEVNKTEYGNCTFFQPLHNWTRGSGRDLVPLNETRIYYIISSNGCYGGLKLEIHVEDPPTPPSTSPPKAKSGSPANLPSTLGTRVFVSALFAVAAVWDSWILIL